MKLLIIGFVFLTTGCAQLMHGQLQPVILKDVKKQIMFTTCSGAAEDWSSCNRKAGEVCTNGYYALEKFENANGGIRELTFKCN